MVLMAVSFCTDSCLSVSADLAQRNVLGERWWESWIQAVNSAAQMSHAEPHASQTRWAVGPTQLWTLFANPTELHACVYNAGPFVAMFYTYYTHYYCGVTVTYSQWCYDTGRLLCYSLSFFNVCSAYLWASVWLLFVYMSQVSLLWVKYPHCSFQRNFLCICRSCYNQNVTFSYIFKILILYFVFSFSA